MRLHYSGQGTIIAGHVVFIRKQRKSYRSGTKMQTTHVSDTEITESSSQPTETAPGTICREEL